MNCGLEKNENLNVKELKALAAVSIFDEEKGFVYVTFQFRTRSLFR